MGYVKKIAYETAKEKDADIYEIKSTEKTAGTLGFWWCGRFGTHRWEMPIEDIDFDLTAYEKVTVCAQVWVFALSAPVRTFCQKASGKINKAEYKILHYSNGKYENAAKEMDEILGLKNTPFTSVICKTGKFKIKCPKKSEYKCKL